MANAGWNRWTPVNLLAIGVHLAGSALLTMGNKGRISAQKGVATTSVVKTIVTAAALAATAYARSLGQVVIAAGDVPVEGGTSAAPQTPYDVASAQRKLDALPWAIPALTGSLLVMDAVMGEQQRASEVASGSAGAHPSRLTHRPPRRSPRSRARVGVAAGSSRG